MDENSNDPRKIKLTLAISLHFRGHITALVRFHMNGSIHFERTFNNTTNNRNIASSPKTITAGTTIKHLQFTRDVTLLARVARKVINAIRRINYCPVDSAVCFVLGTDFQK